MSAKWKKDLHRVAKEQSPLGLCEQCGVCCAFISIPPFREDELDRLPVDLREIVEWYTHNDADRPRSPVPCYFYDMARRLCLIHKHKPQSCKDFEPGGVACKKQRGDLLGALNRYHDATRLWARHYTRVVVPGERIQEMGEFRLDDELEEKLLPNTAS